MMRKRNLFWILSLSALFLVAPELYAQSATQAVLTGHVVDKDGNAIPGVTITASSATAAMAPIGTVTDSNGRFRISPLPPARDYVVVAELPGFAKVEAGPIDLTPGKTTTQNFSLVPSTETTETIKVTAQGDIVDVASTKTATVFNSEFIEGLPIMGRSYQDILTLAPGVTDTDGDGNPNVNGARETDFQTRVDGANTTDPVTGTFGQNLNLESIAEIEIITTGASAEFSQAQGGFANIITKSGGNDFEGSFKFFYRSDLFDNDGANNNDVTSTDQFATLDGFQDFRPFLTVGGPMVKDHLWYFVALQYIDTEVPINTLTLPSLTTNKGWNNFAKLTWQINPTNRLSGQVQSDPRRFTGFGLGTGVAPESDFIFDQGGLTSTVRWTYNISPSLLLETLVSRFDSGIDVLPITDPDACPEYQGECNPFAEDVYTINIQQGTVKGPFNFTSRDERVRDTLRSDLSIFMDTAGGSHNVKTGFEFAKESYGQSVTQGRVRFDNFTTAGGAQVGDALVGNIQFTDSIPATQDVEAAKDNYGAYIQDSYKPRPNLTLNVGLRYDREEASSDGYESFDPEAQANTFMDLYAEGTGTPRDDVVLFPNQVAHDGQVAVFDNPGAVVNDVNGDGLDFFHCQAYDVDGSVLGDMSPDGIVDDFWTYVDGDFDGVLDCDTNPFDFCIQAPDGQPDGTFDNPSCDKKSDDTFALVSVFNRHQFDDVAEPFASLLTLDAARGLPGVPREFEEFTITTNNFAPRLSASWDTWANNKTKFFVTWGRFYDKLFLGTLTPELGPDPRTSVYDPNNQIPGLPPLQTGRFTIRQVDRDMKTPFTDEFTIGFERELAPEWSLGFTFIKRVGRDQLQDIDVNHFTQDLDGDGHLDDNFGSGPTATQAGDDNNNASQFLGVAIVPDGQPDLFAYNPYFNQVLRVGNFNGSEFTSFQLAVTRRLSRQWQMTASYVYSEAFGNAENFLQGLGNDPATVEDEFGPLSFDQTHRIVFNAVTFLPGNQNIGGTVQWASGLPFSLVRQNLSADSFGSFFFRTTFPTEQRNDQRNEGQWLINLAYRKNFVFGKTSAAVGVEVRNLLNEDNLTIFQVDTDRFLGVNAVRDFGRTWQLSFEFHF